MGLPWDDPRSDPVADAEAIVHRYASAEVRRYAAEMEDLIRRAAPLQRLDRIGRLCFIEPGGPAIASITDLAIERGMVDE